MGNVVHKGGLAVAEPAPPSTVTGKLLYRFFPTLFITSTTTRDVGISDKLEKAKKDLKSGEKEETSQDDNRASQQDSIDREALEQELQNVEKSIQELQDRVREMEDRDLMAELEELSVKEQLQEVQKLLDVMDSEDLQERLKMLDRIQDEYQEGRVHEKLEYLYSEVKDMKEEGIEADESRMDELEDRVDDLGQKLEDIKQEQNKTQGNMGQRPEASRSSGLNQIVRGSSDLRVRTNENGEKVVELA